jgi:hypothetical protein
MSRAQRGAVAGLVSVPTTQKPHELTRARSAALRDACDAFVPDPRRSRVASLRRAVGFAARGHLAERAGFMPDQCFMVTATYADAAGWEPNHVRSWLDNIRHWCVRNGFQCRYVWVAELQQRGAMHYHLALFLPASAYLPSSDAQGWWPHGVTRTERAKAAVPYLMKYLSKGTELHQLPKGARMYGVGGLQHSLRRARRWLRLPAFVRARSDVFDAWSPATGGGWWSPDHDIVIPSEFRRSWLGDRYGLVRVADYGRPFQADGPFTWLHRRPEVLQ